MASSTPLAKANTTFSLALLSKLSDNDKTANVFFSPFSISSALAMVMLGARGNTATQMSEVLHFTEPQLQNQPQAEDQLQIQTQSPMQSQLETRIKMQTQIQRTSRLPQYLLKYLKSQESLDQFHSGFSQLLSELNKPDASYALSVANRMFGDQSYQFVETFLEETRKYYNTELETVDFKSAPEEARVNINSWVEMQTQDKIKDLLAQGMVDGLSRLVLVNAIYFKGSWNEHFGEATVDAQFRINKNDTRPVKMMHHKGEFSFATFPEANFQVLVIPYKAEELSMIIFLPKEIEDETTGLEKLEKELTYEKFVEWTRPDLIGQSQVEVNLPRFKMEETYDLNDVLRSMGMVDAFDVTRSMSPANDLMLSKVVHKAFVEVNEEGTEAAVATASILTNRIASIPITFTADHPFLFFIRHNTNMSVLFAGRFCSPE
uniref:Serpin B6 n=1 Tax=Echeneis naucrates TaxID=173247 RepID=A0A665WR03_ECHNA